jgi:hypothetical protein
MVRLVCRARSSAQCPRTSFAFRQIPAFPYFLVIQILCSLSPHMLRIWNDSSFVRFAFSSVLFVHVSCVSRYCSLKIYHKPTSNRLCIYECVMTKRMCTISERCRLDCRRFWNRTKWETRSCLNILGFQHSLNTFPAATEVLNGNAAREVFCRVRVISSTRYKKKRLRDL